MSPRLRILSTVVLLFVLTGAAVAQESGEVADSLTQLNYRFYDRPVNPDQYLIRPGEVLRVVFVGAKVPNLALVVNADGKIASPTLGLFDMNGRTLAQARTALMPILSEYYTAPEINISVGAPIRTAITVTGEVERPGLYLAYTSQFVSEALELAGGVTGFGSTRWITMTGGPEDIPVDLDRANYLGDADANPPIYGGYRIHVPQRSDSVVNIVGYVRHPREIELRPADNLASLLAMAGGVRRDGDSSRMYIVGDSLRDPRTPGAIRSGDVIMVPEMDGGDTSGLVMVFGRITAPGRYPRHSNMTLQSLLQQAGGMLGDANRSRVTVFRRAEESMNQQVTTDRYPITVGRDSTAWTTFRLQHGDSIFIPRTVGFVKVSGEVRSPGLVPFEAGKTASYYINLAGGFLAQSERQQIVITDRISRLASTVTPDAGVRDGDEVRVNRKEILP